MTKLLPEQNYYKTTDISLCSAVCCYGYQIDAIEKNDNSSRAVFLIKRDENLDNLIQLYFTHQLKVEPLSFFNSLKEIKTRIYNA